MQKNAKPASITDKVSKPKSMKRGDDRTKSYGAKSVKRGSSKPGAGY